MSSNKEIQNVVNDVALMVYNIDYIVTYNDPKYSDNSISFPEFYSQINGIPFKLKLKLTSPNTQIYFETKQQFRYRLSFIDANGKHHHNCEHEGWSNLTVEYISLETFDDYFRNNSGVRVYCEVDILTTVNKIYDIPFGDFEAFLETGKLSDMTLSAGGKDFRVHKFVLAARSPMFCEMFENRKHLKRIVIKGWSSDLVEVILKHIYTGCIPSMSEYAFDLFVAADKYQLNLLKSICGNALVILLDVNSFWRVLRTARRCDSTYLKMKLAKFIVENYVELKEKYKNNILLMELYLELEQRNLYSRPIDLWEPVMCLSANAKCAVKEIALLVWNIKKSDIQKILDAQVSTKDSKDKSLTIVSPYFYSNISNIGFKFKIGLTLPYTQITIGRGCHFSRLYDDEIIHFRYRFYFLDANGQKHHYFEHEAWNIHSVKYISLKTFEKYFCVNGYVKVICEVDVLTTLNPFDDFEQFLETGKLSDMTLSAGGKDFRVHKFVLAARSPVFAAMFEHKNSKEMQQNRISIEDMSSDVCDAMLKHIYTGSIPSMSEFAFDLYVAADKYQLNKLKSICAFALEKLLEVNTFCSVLLIAEGCNAKVLKSKCLDFFGKNSRKIMKTDGWKQLKRKKVLKTSKQFRFRLYFLDSNGNKHYNCENEGLSYSTVEYIPLKTFENYFLENGRVKVYCEVDLLTSAHEIVENYFGNFKEFLETGKLSDMILSAGGKDFRVHKFVLAARSSVFCAMFENIENLDRITIEDISSDGCEAMLKFIYTGCIPSMSEYALDLYVAVHKYQLTKLKSICAYALNILMNVGNFCQILQIAHSCNSPELKVKCIEFFSKNCDAIMQTDGWNEIVGRKYLFIEWLQQPHSSQSAISSRMPSNQSKYIVTNVILLVWDIDESDIQRILDNETTQNSTYSEVTIFSPLFCSQSTGDICCKLKITSSFGHIDTQIIFGVPRICPDFSTRFQSLNDSNFKYRYRFSFLDANGEKHHNFEYESWNRCFFKYISLETFENYFRVNGKVKVYCEVDILSTMNPFDDFGDFLETGKLSDMTLSAGGKHFRVHKFVLAARSPVFGAMFEHKDTREAQENRISIEDMSSDVCEAMLRHIYTGSISSNMNEYAFDLFVATDKYQLNHLKPVCAYALGILVDVDSFCRVLLIADCCNAPMLKSKCLDFFSKTEFSKFFKVLKTEGWKQIESNKDLMRQVVEHMPKT